MTNMQYWIELLKKLPSAAKTAIGVVTLVLTFVFLVLQNVYLSVTVVIVLTLLSALVLSIYVAFSRKESPIQPERYIYRFSRYRPLAFTGIIIIPLLIIILIAYKPTRSFGTIAFVGTATVTPTATPLPTVTSTSTNTPTPTVSPTPLPTNTPNPTPTPTISFVGAFPQGKVGIVITHFGRGNNFEESEIGKDISEALYRNLDNQIQKSGLGQVVVAYVRKVIKSEIEATELGNSLNAALVVWGRIASDNQTTFPNFTVLPIIEGLSASNLDAYLITPLDGSRTIELGEQLSSRTSLFASFIIGLSHMSNRDYEQAVNEFNRTIRLTHEVSGTDVLYYHRGLAYFGMSNFDKALADFQQALDLNPDNPSVYVGIGSAYYAKDDWEKATEMYNKALKLQPDFTEAIHGLGLVNFIQGNNEEALTNFQHAVTTNKEFSITYCALGQVYRKLGDRAEAISAYENCIKFAKSNQIIQDLAKNNLLLAQKLPVAPILTRSTLTQTQLVMTGVAPENDINTDTSTILDDSSQQQFPYPSPQPINPSDGTFISQGPVRFEWEWPDILAPNEYFDLKIRPIDSPNSIYFDWTKETFYIFNPVTDPIPPLEGGKKYVWSVQVLEGHYDESGNKVKDEFLSPESRNHEFHRTESLLPAYPVLLLPETGRNFNGRIRNSLAMIFFGVILLTVGAILRRL
ncbi:MAG: tetratricopeptide repeat protein [Anaerolineales bacterium]|nr:tetratricopeptide repeat protein [Anaerolineales bacterium]